jgi:serine/threonine protein kinase
MNDLDSQVRMIGKYQILGPLGRGSMGLVYRAKDPEIGRDVAIKTLRKLISADPADLEAAVKRFKFEARSAGNLRHPNVITIFEVNHDKDTPYIVMDYVEGESLDVVIEKERKLSPSQMVQYLYQIAGGLDYAHSRGVIHRDIKPSNLLVDKSGNVFILDFGIASINESFPGSESSGTFAPIMGTPGYMSPEQISNEKLDNRTDLFSLAVVAFECLTGQRPFPGDSFTTVIGNILNSKPLSLTALVPELPLALEAEFERALAKKKEDRFDSAQHMVRAFASAAGVQLGASGVQAPVRTRKISAWNSLKKVWGNEEGPSKAPVITEPKQPVGAGASAPWESPRSSGVYDDPIYSGAHRGAKVTPGSLFENPSQNPGNKQQFIRYKESPARKIALLVALACLGGAGWFIWLALNQQQDARQLVLDQPIVVAPINQLGEELVVPSVDPVPANKTVHEMSDRELLGVLVRGGVNEETIIEAMREARRRSVPSLVDATVVPLQHDSFLVRLEALRLLAELGDKRIVPQMLLSMDDHDPLVRKEAAITLGKLGDRRALGYLNARILKEEAPEVRAEIKRAIEQINGFPMR